MITVLAFDRSDGWVFARDGERILLLRPPYHLAGAPVASENVVARAVMHQGYTACDRELPAWADVVDFVRGEVVAQRRAEGRALPLEGEAGRAVLKTAPVTLVQRFLERIETELLPRGDLDAAEKILLALQAESPRLRETPALTQQAAALLEALRARRIERTRAVLRDDTRFPRLAKAGRLEENWQRGLRVAQGGSMFFPSRV